MIQLAIIILAGAMVAALLGWWVGKRLSHRVVAKGSSLRVCTTNFDSDLHLRGT